MTEAVPYTDREFVTEMRRGLIIIMRAMMRRWGLAWADLQPRVRATEPTATLALDDVVMTISL